MPELERGALVELPKEMAPGSQPVNSVGDLKQQLDKFTESLHQKAAQVTAWILNLNTSPLDRAKKLAA